jgi:tetratricopeptide (TPR) repeat protein
METLTEANIVNLKWDDSKRTRSGNVPKHQIHNDPDVSGHHIKLYPPKATGRSGKVFYLGYGPSTNRKFYRIGQWGDVTLEQARAEARKIRAELHRFGIDPNKARRERIQVAKRRLTVKQLVAEDFKERSPAWSNNYTAGNRGFAKRGGRAKGETEDVTHPADQGDLWEEIVREVVPKPNEEKSIPVVFVKDLAEFPDPQDVDDSGDGGISSVQEESREHDDSEAASGPDGQDADTEVQLALSLDPTSLEVRAEQGLLAFRKGLNAAAEEVLRGVCKQDPRHAAAHFYLGEALNRLGRVAEAVAAMERVIELQPHNWRAYHTLGMLFDRMHESERAAEMHRRASELMCVDSAQGVGWDS